MKRHRFEYNNAITIPEFGVLRVMNLHASEVETEDETDVTWPQIEGLTDSFELRFRPDHPKPQRKELQPSLEEWQQPPCGPTRPSTWIED
jgi:hypothetical protein